MRFIRLIYCLTDTESSIVSGRICEDSNTFDKKVELHAGIIP